MAQRQRERKVNSEIVQGAHSFVLIRRITLDEAKLFREDAKKVFVNDDTLSEEENDVLRRAFEDEKEHQARELISKYIIKWDWVDDEGNAMPQPFNNPSAFEKLTDLEWAFLQGALTDTSDLEKKPPSKKG